MGMVRFGLSTLFALAIPMSLVTGCGSKQAAADVVHVQQTSYDPGQQKLTIKATKAKENSTGENYVNINDREGLANFATYAAPGQSVKKVVVTGLGQAQTRDVASVQPDTTGAPNLGAFVAQGVRVPGVWLDHRIRPRAGLRAPVWKKEQAVMSVARSKLGTPYIWGHNEDRGQYGFDCSNYIAYVYHHALGYHMYTSSKYQYHRVGTPVARRYMRVGDLVIFERGKHVGIYAGNSRVIEEGGGLGKVGYLSIGPRSYWGKRITVVKRMF